MPPPTAQSEDYLHNLFGKTLLSHEGYTSLGSDNFKKKMNRGGGRRRIQYFYNILLLIGLSLILYLFSSQILSQNGGDEGGGESRDKVVVGKLLFTSGSSSSGVSSRSNDFSDKYDKTGYGQTNAMGETESGGDSGAFDRVTPSGGSTTTNFDDVQHTTTKDWIKVFSETAHKLYSMFSPDYLKEFRKWAVKQQREVIEREMKGYKYQTGKKGKLNDLVMEKGGQPIRNVIFTTWRSGSTFLGETLDSHPGTFYHYEPLLHFNIKQVRSGELAKEGLRVLNQLLSCNYTGLNDFMEYGKTHHWLYSHNTRVWQYCEKSYDVCWDAKFLSDMCKLFPFQSVKTVRMRLRLAKTLLENKKLNIRLLLLVRDPRGTMQSRNHRDWCPEDPDCYDPSKLCMDMVDDFNYAEKLRTKYPDRFLPIRYEDMSLYPYESMQKIFKFFRLQYHPQVEKFLSSHTVENVGGVSSTFRDSKTTPFHWRNDFIGNFSLVSSIQTKCDAAMKLWGYSIVSDESQLLSFNPLKRPPWPEMFVLNSTKDLDEMYVK